MDTLRRKEIDNLSDEVAPFLTSEEVEYIENYYSNSPWSPPAHASIFSGMLPSEHGTDESNILFDSENKISEMLGEEYYKSGLSENSLITSLTGFSRGFDSFEYVKEENMGGPVWKEVWKIDQDFTSRIHKWRYFVKESLIRKDTSSLKRLLSYALEKNLGENPKYNSTKTSKIFEKALEELEEDRKSFIFINITPVHHPYTFGEKERSIFFDEEPSSEILKSTENFPPEKHINGEKVKTPRMLNLRKKAYQASILYTDRKIENFYRDAPEDTAFLITSDHGELIGEQKIEDVPITSHQYGTFKELLQVPCFCFKKGSEIDINTDNILDHRDIVRIIKCLSQDEEINGIGRDITRAEYLSAKTYVKNYKDDYPEEADKIYSRKSFSVLDGEYRFEIASEGECVWDLSSSPEKKSDNGEAAEYLKAKADIFYSGLL